MEKSKKKGKKMKPNPKYISYYYENMKEFPELDIDPKKTALLIVDMQKEFVSREIGESVEFKKTGEWERWLPFHDRLDEIVIPNNIKLLNYFREKSLVVTFGRIACLRSDGEDRTPIQKTAGWNGIFLYINTEEAEMIDELKPFPNEIVVNKTTDSVVSGTNYSRLIRNLGIETVVVTGIVTDQCVASTVRGLADDGFKVICVEDASAAATMELHDAELKIMNLLYCNVLSTDETIKVLKGELK
jgi:nicotinamidase-related amidase